MSPSNPGMGPMQGLAQAAPEMEDQMEAPEVGPEAAMSVIEGAVSQFGPGIIPVLKAILATAPDAGAPPMEGF